jgi:hypothetical protein
MLPLYLEIGDHVGPFHPDLLAAWNALGEGAACPRCGATLEEGWCGPTCATCARARRVALGCRCGGSNLCPECQAVGATEATRGEIRCEAHCSTLCPVCSPDD